MEVKLRFEKFISGIVNRIAGHLTKFEYDELIVPRLKKFSADGVITKAVDEFADSLF